MNWTVSLSWGSPFFISVVDGAGNFWANGPLHSGENGPTTCLSGGSISSSNGLSTGVAVGAGVGGLAVGALAGIISAYLFMKSRRRKEQNRLGGVLDSPTAGYYDQPSNYSAVPSTPFSGQFDSSTGSNPSSNNTNRLTSPPSHYQLEPFGVPFEDGALRPARSQNLSVAAPTSPTEPQAPGPSSSHVYVVHHDGGRAPVTVYHEDGTEVVELPPRYIGSDQSTTDSRPGTNTTESRGKRAKAGGAR